MEQFWTPPFLRAVYPNLISKELVYVWPIGCLMVEDEVPEKDSRLLEFVVYEMMGPPPPEGCLEVVREEHR